MSTSSKLATLGVAGVLAITPGAALAAGHGNGHKPPKPGQTTTTTTTTTPPTKAFGKYCQFEAKHHGTLKGTDFSRCVQDMAKLAHHKTNDPRVACKDEPKTHVAGEKGTAYSRCVVAGNRLLQSMRKSSKS